MSFIDTCVIKYSSYDNHFGTDKTTTHSYGEFYDRVFAEFKAKAKPSMNIMEIGVFSGAFSTAMSEYFPQAHIHGVDITLQNIKFGNNVPNVTFHQRDATQPDTVKFFADNNVMFDIIVDDGSHRVQDQYRAFELFAPLLQPDGIFIIEDVDEKYCEQLKSLLQRHDNTHEMTVHDLRKNKNRYDDIIITMTPRMSQ